MIAKIYCLDTESPAFIQTMRERGYEVVTGRGIELDKISDVDVLCPIATPVDASVLDAAPKCRLVMKVGVGVNNIDLDECARRGIPVINTPGSNTISVAEHAIALMFAVGHHVWERGCALKLGDKPDWAGAQKYVNFECFGKTFGVIGFGSNGKHAAMMAHGIGMKVLVFSEHSKKEDVPEYVELAGSLDELLARVDVVSLHIAATPAQKNFMDAEKFSKMKDGAIFINITRGFVVDEDALIAALKSGKLFGAGLDVFNEEPPVHESELYKLPNVVTTPHCAYSTPENGIRTVQMEVENVVEYIEHGRIPEGRLRNNPVK